MRSIRVSLLVYFLGLLVVALGVASVLVYRSAQQTLADKEEATAEFINAKYEERLDAALLDQAQALIGRLQLEWNGRRMYYLPNPIVVPNRSPGGDRPPGSDRPPAVIPISNSIHSLGAITAAFTPSGYLTAAPWCLQFQLQQQRFGEGWRPPPPGVRPPPERGDREPPPPPPYAAWEIWRRYVADIELNEPEFPLPDTERAVDYFQIDINHWGKPLRSDSLGKRSFPDPEGFASDKTINWEADDFELAPGEWVRRMRVKSSHVRPRPGGRPRGGRPPTPLPVASSPSTATDPARTRGRSPTTLPPLFVVVQVAADKSNANARVNGLREKRDQELDDLRDQTIRALTSLRNRLLTISSVTFIATVLGTWFLVRLGLIPLQRMSDAVSKISPRDFRLQLGDSPLPAELRPIAERLTVTLDQLKRAFAREKQSTADISHELRTPLAAMLTTTELALRKLRTPEQYREFLQDCRGSAQQMNQIVERLLTLARLDAGVDRLRPQSVDVADLAEQCAAVVRPLAEAQGLRLCVSSAGIAGEEPADNSTRLTTDPDKLREVLNNLLHNAIQYNRPSGQIDLSVARDNGHVRVEVRDTGIGIAPEARELIFERFYRADPSRTGDGMNAGLGLAIVKEYVELMGGRIVVDSAPGQGSTFRVDLPATPAA
jgi:heavy metal sensor kinase